MQRIGLFGGSFNPIHNGHLHLAQTARESLGLDQVVLIPANVSPFKQQNPDMASGADRLAMCRLAAETLPFCTVDGCELERAGVSYTVDTVRLFRTGIPKQNWCCWWAAICSCHFRSGTAGKRFWKWQHWAWCPAWTGTWRNWRHREHFYCNMAKFFCVLLRFARYLLQKFAGIEKIMQIFLAIYRKK